MVTKIPLVTVTRTEAGGFLIHCEDCPNYRTIRPSRPAADETARAHERSHTRPDPADQVHDWAVG